MNMGAENVACMGEIRNVRVRVRVCVCVWHLSQKA